MDKNIQNNLFFLFTVLIKQKTFLSKAKDLLIFFIQ